MLLARRRKTAEIKRLPNSSQKRAGVRALGATVENGLVVSHFGPRPVVSLKARTGPLFWMDQAVPRQQRPSSSLLLTSQPNAGG